MSKSGTLVRSHERCSGEYLPKCGRSGHIKFTFEAINKFAFGFKASGLQNRVLEDSGFIWLMDDYLPFGGWCILGSLRDSYLVATGREPMKNDTSDRPKTFLYNVTQGHLQS